MVEAGGVGLGRLTLSRRERMVMVEPRGAGMAPFTLRAAGEVRAVQFPSAERELDPEMVAIARAIIAQRTDKFDPSTYRDRYQEALQELIEAKVKGLPIKPREVSAPAPVIDLMAALKRSLAQETPAKGGRADKERRIKVLAYRRQPSLLLPMSGAEGARRSPLSSISDARRLERRRYRISSLLRDLTVLARLRGRMTTVPMPFVPSPV